MSVAPSPVHRVTMRSRLLPKSLPRTTLALSLWLVACGESDDRSADAGAVEDTAMFDMAGGFVGCETAVPYSEGLAIPTASGAYEVQLVSAVPAPPDVEENDWTVALVPVGGSDGLVGVEFAIEPWMPAHGHGVFPPRAMGTSGADGVASIDTFNIIMPGFWEFRVSVTLSDGSRDTALFAFCVRG